MQRRFKYNINELTNFLLEKGFDKETIEKSLTCKKFFKSGHQLKRGEAQEIKIDYDLCKYLYEEKGLAIFRIAMLYNMSENPFRKILVSKGLNNQGHKYGKNSNNDFFKNINSPAKAYYLGLIVADGSVVKAKKSCTIRIELAESDGYILEKFNKIGNFNEKIGTYINNKKGQNKKYITINSTKMAEDLAELKVYPNKTNIGYEIPPQLLEDKTYLHHFIRGFFDGDGIAFSNGRIGFCGCKKMMEQLWDIFVNDYGFNETKITYNKSNHIYYLHWAAKKDIKKFIQEIYKDNQGFYLTRKLEKIMNKFKGASDNKSDEKLVNLEN